MIPRKRFPWGRAMTAVLWLLPAPAILAQPDFRFTPLPLPEPLASYRATAGDNHGPGGVFTDLDRDGYADLVLVTGPEKPTFIYRNVPAAEPGRRTFALAWLLPARPYGSAGAVAGDYDNDGDLDLFLLNHPFHNLLPSHESFTRLDFAPDELWKNLWAETGVLAFENVTAATDPTPEVDDGQHGLAWSEHEGQRLDNSLTAAWSDVDRDGDLDLFVGHHDGTAPGPHENPVAGQRDTLYRNNGDGTFTDVTMAAGVPGFEAADGSYCGPGQCFSSTNAAAFADFDGDGWPDLLVTNKANNPGFDADMLYVNRGVDPSGIWLGFECRTWQTTPPFARASDNAMGVDVADFDNDGDADVYITDVDCKPVGGCDDRPPNDLFKNLLVETGRLDFAEASDDVKAAFSWGAQWLDADLDGWLDLHVATAGFRRDFLYMQEDGRFIDRAAILGVDQRTRGKSDFATDFDRDGDVDLLVLNTSDPETPPYSPPPGSEPLALYENRVPAGSPGHHYLVLELEGDPTLPPAPFLSSRDAIGARVRVTAEIGGPGTALVTQTREVVSGCGNAASTSGMALEFGLGHATYATVEIRWPSGRVTLLGDVAADRYLAVAESAEDGLRPMVTVDRRPLPPVLSGPTLSVPE